MKKYFLLKVKHRKAVPGGQGEDTKTVTDTYYQAAHSTVEAIANATTTLSMELKDMEFGDTKPLALADVIRHPDTGTDKAPNLVFFTATISFEPAVADGLDTKKVAKRVRQTVVVEGVDYFDAAQRVKEHLATWATPVRVHGLVDLAIVDVLDVPEAPAPTAAAEGKVGEVGELPPTLRVLNIVGQAPVTSAPAPTE
jgi:hypothetical protein